MQVRSGLTTTASVTITDENADDYAVIKNADGGRKIWVQSTAPSSGVTDGDIWIKTT